MLAGPTLTCAPVPAQDMFALLRPPAPMQIAPQATPQATAPVSVKSDPGDGQDENLQLSARLQRQVVHYASKEAAGTIVVDTPHTLLYYLLGNGKAIRYGIGVGRKGFTWSGVKLIVRKTLWPDWYPPPEMIARQPYLPRMIVGGPVIR